MSSKIPENLIIVVGRQYGSGGRMLGKLLAARFSLPYYDKEILSEAAQRYGFSKEIFAKYDEKRPSPLRSLLENTLGVQDIFSTQPLSGENIYNAQGRVIRELAEQGGAVFVGRSADYILREHPNLVSIFLHSPLDSRARNIVARGEAPDVAKAAELASRIDSKRENFYNYFTGRRWGHAANYHLTLDASLLPAQEAFQVICNFIERRFGNQ